MCMDTLIIHNLYILYLYRFIYMRYVCIFFIFLHVFLRQTFQGLPKKRPPLSSKRQQPKQVAAKVLFQIHQPCRAKWPNPWRWRCTTKPGSLVDKWNFWWDITCQSMKRTNWKNTFSFRNYQGFSTSTFPQNYCPNPKGFLRFTHLFSINLAPFGWW